MEFDTVSYFLLFYVIARLEWLNYKIGKLESKVNEINGGEKK